MNSNQTAGMPEARTDAHLRLQARARAAVVEFLDDGEKGEGWYVQYHGGVWNALHHGSEGEGWAKVFELMCLTQQGDLIMSTIAVEDFLEPDTPSLSEGGGAGACRYDIRQVNGKFLVLLVASQAMLDRSQKDVWQIRYRSPFQDFAGAAHVVRTEITYKQRMNAKGYS